MSLVLRAGPEVEIELPSGEPLGSLETHLTLQAGLASPRDLASELAADDVGFLLHSKAGADPPFIHGAVAWPTADLPYHLLTRGLRASVLLSFSSIQQILEYQDSFVWQPGRGAILRIGSYSINCTSALVP
ncbi:hypothetical protein MKFW12EY_08390 [Methylomonas koyamae]|nr:hypothetical protein MKFW12EY_08390 [Methylomonas koyamae]